MQFQPRPLNNAQLALPWVYEGIFILAATMACLFDPYTRTWLYGPSDLTSKIDTDDIEHNTDYPTPEDSCSRSSKLLTAVVVAHIVDVFFMFITTFVYTIPRQISVCYEQCKKQHDPQSDRQTLLRLTPLNPKNTCHTVADLTCSLILQAIMLTLYPVVFTALCDNSLQAGIYIGLMQACLTGLIAINSEISRETEEDRASLNA